MTHYTIPELLEKPEKELHDLATVLYCREHLGKWNEEQFTFELLDELAAGVNGFQYGFFQPINYTDGTTGHKLVIRNNNEKSSLLAYTGFDVANPNPSAAFPRLISVAYIFCKQQATIPPKGGQIG